MNMNDKNFYNDDYEYNKNFWMHMKGNQTVTDKLKTGKTRNVGTYKLPATANDKYEKAIAKESIFRSITSVFYRYDTDSNIIATYSDDIAQFIPEGSAIDIKTAENDFTKISIGRHKLVTLFKITNEFIQDNAFNFESYLVKRLAKAYAKAEDKAFILGNGNNEPIGILSDTNGAETGVTTSSVTYDDVIKLYFSIEPEYRKNAVWMMNDATAFTLRTLKDSNGNYLWNTVNDSILGKPVIICNDMPEMAIDNKPIAFGDFSYYWIVKRSPVSVKCLQELFALHDQNGYLGCEFIDGKLVRRDAVKVLKITE